MDYFNDVFAAFLGLDRVIGSLLSMGGSQSFRIKKKAHKKNQCKQLQRSFTPLNMTKPESVNISLH